MTGSAVGLRGWSSLVMLADARLPAGGHVHSGGVEQAVDDGLIVGEADLQAWLHRRLLTTGHVLAGLAAAACGYGEDALRRLDGEADARMPAPAARAASRAMGRSLARLAARVWPDPHWWGLLGPRPHQCVALGVAGRAAGVGVPGIALVAAYTSLTSAATSAQRLLGLDPAAVTALLAALGPAMERVADDAAACAYLGDPALLPMQADLLLDLLVERHTIRKERLFVS